jgi:hypothetical protein
LDEVKDLVSDAPFHEPESLIPVDWVYALQAVRDDDERTTFGLRLGNCLAVA